MKVTDKEYLALDEFISAMVEVEAAEKALLAAKEKGRKAKQKITSLQSQADSNLKCRFTILHNGGTWLITLDDEGKNNHYTYKLDGALF